MPELLAPAGGMDSLRAAVQNGADAVYIGARAFNARASAENFDWDDVGRAADYCHLRGVLLYLTLNTMMLQSEMQAGVAAARQAYLTGADALIVADTGLAEAIQTCCPDIPLHASTQMCVHNVPGARLIRDLGFKRVVLARELSIAEIRAITESGVETEVFIHGALCSSVSGLCLLSSFIGQRSGNRGRCAQPCRLEYKVDGKDAYYLSMADLCAAPLMTELAVSGIASFKIEGRMKNSRYVGGVVHEYRRILDALAEGKNLPKGSIENLKDYYNRTFTNDYLTGGTDVTAIDCSGNRNIDKARMEDTEIKGAEKTVFQVKASVRLEEGKPVWMRVATDGFLMEVIGEEQLPEAKKPLDEQIIRRSVQKTGGTPFETTNVDVAVKGNPFVSVSGMNRLRKRAFYLLEEEILKKYHMRVCTPCNLGCREMYPHELAQVFVQTASSSTAIESLRMGAGRVYYAPERMDEKSFADAKKILDETGQKPYIVLPPFLRQDDMKRIKALLDKNHTIFEGALAGNFSQITLLKDLFQKVVADYTCNIANRHTVCVYEKMGFTGIALSAEMSKKDINAVKGVLPTESVVYGYLPLMWLAHPLETEQISDRRGYAYSVRRYTVHYEVQAVLNPVLMAMREISSIRAGVDAVRLILEEKTMALPEYIRAVREGENVRVIDGSTTQGHLKRGV